MSDQRLHDLLPDYRVPRAFDVSALGCPVHGATIYRHGTYPWKLDREHPFTITCPEGGEHYPSNDFEAYYRSGMKDPQLLTGPYSDSGRGWVAPDGQRYWLVAYACHWNWMKNWIPAVVTLSEAYILTGNPLYAHKAIVLLDRIAEVYPGMEHSKQSRYGELMKGKYYGKIVNAIWETGVLERLAIAYDRVFPALTGGDAVSLPWRSAAEIRAHIEANLLEEGIDGVEKRWVSGNYGLHQNALIHTALVRQNGPTQELLRGVFEQTGKDLRYEGLNYALYNLVYKDGMPYESSPNYDAMWLESFVNMARPLSQAGFDLIEHPKMKRMFDAPLNLVCAGRFTPAIGDSGSIDSAWIVPNREVYEAAYRRYREPRYAWALEHMNALKEDRIQSFEDLFKDSIVEAARIDAKKHRPRSRSRLLDGFGAAILNNSRDSVSASMYYGVRNVHSHKDCLNLELFGQGRRLTPDLGYPDQTDNFHSGIFSWTQHTVSHNCVVVDRSPQDLKDVGRVLRIHDSPTVHVVDIEASRTYSQADVYRRTLLQVDTDEEGSYFVDVFRVRGGKDHVLSIHGAAGEFAFIGADLPAPVTEGTLAGPEVDHGELYDDPVLGKPGYDGSFSGYRGSGYSHFFNWQRVMQPGPVIAQWVFSGSETTRLRVHIPQSEGQEITVADAHVSPQKKIPTILKYVLLRRAGTAVGNTFVTIWESPGRSPGIDRVELTPDPRGTGCETRVSLAVHRGPETDFVTVAPMAGSAPEPGAKVRTDAAVAVCTLRGDGCSRAFAAGGGRLFCDGREVLQVPQTLFGTVLEVDYASAKVVVEVKAALPASIENADRPARFFNSEHSSIHRVTCQRAGETRLLLGLDDPEILTGRLRVASCNSGQRSFITSSFSPHAANLAGMHVVDGDMAHLARIKSITKGHVELDGDRAAPGFDRMLKAIEGRDVWLADFGPGDTVEIEGMLYRGSAAP